MSLDIWENFSVAPLWSADRTIPMMARPSLVAAELPVIEERVLELDIALKMSFSSTFSGW
jgi:hypothetical protein